MVASTRPARYVPKVLRTNRDFRYAFAGDLLSSLGAAMSMIAFPLLVLALGGSAIQAGAIATIALVTRLALRLPAGYLVDRTNRRSVMLATDLVRAVALASIPLVGVLGQISYPHLVAIALVEGIASAVFVPASFVLTRDILTERQVADGLGLSQGSQATVSLLGPAIGGALYGVDPLLPFAADAASYVCSAVLIWQIARPPTPHARAARDADRMGDGLRWLARQRSLLTILAFAAAINLVGAALDVLVVLVLRAQGVSSSYIGVALSCAGLGAIVGALLAPRFSQRLRVSALLLGISGGWSVALVAFAAVSSTWFVAAVLVVLMVLSPAAGVVVGHAMITATPRDLLGRVSAASTVLLSGLSALGPLFAGALFTAAGRTGSWLVLAAVTIVATLVCWRPLRAIGQIASAVGPADAVAGGDGPPDGPRGATLDLVAHWDKNG
ncbi:MFS transporter [Micromonospora carbonacea]|uniref:MFS transporter n=1 Tax=Micromonospora carbonacea TaxID=47853 RepID=UPI0033EE5891